MKPVITSLKPKDSLFKITHAENGFVVEAVHYEDENFIVVSEKCRGDDEVDGFADFLRVLNEHFGPCTGKYSSKRVRVIVIPGYCYDGKLDEKYRESLIDLKEDLDALLKDLETHDENNSTG